MITAQLFGTEKLVAKFGRMGGSVQSSLQYTMERLAIKLTRHIKEDKLTGQMLKVQTGTLKRSINYRVTKGPQSITATVGTNIIYARVHEYGFSGTVTVREHLRTVKQVWGKPVTPFVQTVSAHQARRNIPQRSFMRSSLADMRSEIIERMSAAVKQTAQQVTKA